VVRDPPLLLYVVNVPWYFVAQWLALARGAREAGYEVHVATADDEGADELGAEGFPLHFLPVTRRGLAPIRESSAICRLYRRLRPDLVHHLTIKPVVLGGVCARLARIPAVVNTFTGLGFVFTAEGMLARARRASVLAAYRIALKHPRSRAVFQNRADLDYFRKLGLVAESEAILIPGVGVDLNRFAPSPEPRDEPVVMLVARMLRDKGIEEFVQAARSLKAAGIEARFVLVGVSDPGNPTAISDEQLQGWHREGVVECWGYRRDVDAVLRQAHVICLPSYREGLPTALIEAAASARAIVATDVPGCRDVVRHEDNGLLVPPRDATALSNALQRLIEDPRTRRRMAERGRQIAEAEFGVERIVARTLNVYKTLLAEHFST
jgi:glycosyltransferase involved in cell wall biosynthesis